MEKPKPEVITALNYIKCRDYIEEKYGILERDYAGKFHGDPPNPHAPYQDFWHWVMDNNPGLGNGSRISFSVHEEDIPLEEDWVQEILNLYRKEFGEYADDEGFLTFWVEW